MKVEGGPWYELEVAGWRWCLADGVKTASWTLGRNVWNLRLI
jgi:hypothetical protein